MRKDDPFGFDMSVSASKKKNPRGRRGMSGAFDTSTRECEHEGCHEAGKYRAPKSPDSLDEFFWFCQKHVREYNLKWNFFNGQSEEEMAKRMDKDKVWERETKPFRKSVEEQAWARLGISDAHEVLGGNATQNPGKSITGTRRLPPTERRAIEILEAKDHIGGRAYTHYEEWEGSDVALDQGAMWIQNARGNLLNDYIKKYKIPTHTSKFGMQVYQENNVSA